MFEISFPELVLIAIVGLLVIGPERLPEALRTLGLWLGRMRRSFLSVKSEIEKEIGMDEVRRQLHNEAIMEEMKRIEAEVKNTANYARKAVDEGARSAGAGAPTATPVIDPNTQGSVSDLLAAQGGELKPAPRNKPADELEPPDRANAMSDSDAADVDRADDRDHTDAAEPPPSVQPAVRDAAKGS